MIGKGTIFMNELGEYAVTRSSNWGGSKKEVYFVKDLNQAEFISLRVNLSEKAEKQLKQCVQLQAESTRTVRIINNGS